MILGPRVVPGDADFAVADRQLRHKPAGHEGFERLVHCGQADAGHVGTDRLVDLLGRGVVVAVGHPG